MKRPTSIVIAGWMFLFIVAANPVAAYGQNAIPVSSVVRKHQEPAHPIDPALAFVRESLAHVQNNVDDYTAVFVKRCRVDGEMPPLQYAKIKIRNRKTEADAVVTPMGVYLDFIKPSSVKGREVIWVEGQNDGNMIVHQGGLARFVTLKLDPTGYLAMRGQRYPLTDIGIEKLLIKILEVGQRDRQHPECEVKFYPDARLGSQTCTMVEVVHPVKRDHFDFYRARVYFSDDLNVPIRYRSWSWPESEGDEPVLQEEYNYLKLKVNVGLTDRDFDSANPEYRYN